MKSSASSILHAANKRAFIKRFVYFELRLAGVFFVLLSILALWQSNQSDAHVNEVQSIRETPAPLGMHYVDYCDGRPSEVLMPLAEATCLADFPGEFALETVAALLGLLFLLISLVAFAVLLRRSRLAHRQNKNP